MAHKSICKLPKWSGRITTRNRAESRAPRISCVPKSQHGAASGVILFYTCLSAVLAPLAMGAVSDVMGGPMYGFALATGFAALLFIGLLLNKLFNPAGSIFEQADQIDYNSVTGEEL